MSKPGWHEITDESPAQLSDYDYTIEFVFGESAVAVYGKDGSIRWFPALSEPITSANWQAICDGVVRKMIAEKVFRQTDTVFVNGLPIGSRHSRQEIQALADRLKAEPD